MRRTSEERPISRGLPRAGGPARLLLWRSLSESSALERWKRAGDRAPLKMVSPRTFRNRHPRSCFWFPSGAARSALAQPSPSPSRIRPLAPAPRGAAAAGRAPLPGARPRREARRRREATPPARPVRSGPKSSRRRYTTGSPCALVAPAGGSAIEQRSRTLPRPALLSFRGAALHAYTCAHF